MSKPLIWTLFALYILCAAFDVACALANFNAGHDGLGTVYILLASIWVACAGVWHSRLRDA